MFPTAHYGNPGSYAGFTSVDCRKEPFSGKDKSMADTRTSPTGLPCSYL
ncbi:hypothetical protein AAH083_18110 [Bacteroides xylanisolvens]|nr:MULTISPECIES: hypothetical protein [Bacteroides]UYU75357.1 hypothetical protein KQP72_20145 [Bacteroides thetaiotaomicron]